MGSRTRTEVPPSSVPCSQQGAWREDKTRQEEPGGVGGVRGGRTIFGGRVFSSVRGRVDTYTSGQGSPAAIQVFFLVIFCLELQLLDKVSVDMKVLAIIKK